MAKKLWPFFCFYGGKWRAAPHYPQPDYPVVIEPFAGAAGYSVRYHDRAVKLTDVDPIIAGIWRYLISVSEYEFQSLPAIVDHVDDLICPQEAKWLIGFCLNKATASPCKSPSAWMRGGIRPNSMWGKVIRARIASQLSAIRHWEISERSYTDVPNEEATWFIDPPYDNAAGRLYRHRLTDYGYLAKWCETRAGQVIVCENAGATWLPFQPLGKFKSTEGKRGKAKSAEVIFHGF